MGNKTSKPKNRPKTPKENPKDVENIPPPVVNVIGNVILSEIFQPEHSVGSCREDTSNDNLSTSLTETDHVEASVTSEKKKPSELDKLFVPPTKKQTKPGAAKRKQKYVAPKNVQELTVEQLQILKTCSLDDHDTSYAGLCTKAKVCHVYDGDTIRIRFFDRDALVQKIVRLMHIDSPEMKPIKANRTQESVDAEKKAATAARDFLTRLVLNQIVDVKLYGIDKFGRELAELELDGKLIHNIMVEEGHAVPYEGKTKLVQY